MGAVSPGSLRITAVTCVKNEGPFLLEWIAYHRLIGVSDFLFYSNDCTDGTDVLLDVLAARGGLRHLPNPATGRGYQMEALKDARKQPELRRADWVWIADVDEFPEISCGGHGLADLIAACGDAQAISLPFRYFGNAGVERFVDRPVIEQFRRTHPAGNWNESDEIEVKTLVRRDFPLRYFGAHRPFAREGSAPRWVDAAARAVPADFAVAGRKARMRRFPAPCDGRLATLNHYALRARDSYLVKADRGDVNRAHRAFDAAYWHERNENSVPEGRITRHLPALDAALIRLRSDPQTDAAHRACVQAHRARRDGLLESAQYRALYQALDTSPASPVISAGPGDKPGKRLPAGLRPRNDLVGWDETVRRDTYRATECPPGRLIVACMKDEAPYILEWIAHHRAIGIADFLIYTNDCSDGTNLLLDRLDAMGIVTHRRNDAWRGKSPQQHALNSALREDIYNAAEWVAHIDVDEFINVRCGNGTLDDFLDRVPQASHVAMTWRLFGHGGIETFADLPVTQQFTKCAPSFLPKPHTCWGIKTLGRPGNAYAKLGGHRPNRLDPARTGDVTWVNGSGKDVSRALRRKGWRSARGTVGYDLLQLNHYALRSADSFLIKRARGRALHVDRSIGLNYWARMDWNDAVDLSVQRNLPRMTAERTALMADPALAGLHDAGVAWHRERAGALRADPAYASLLSQALGMRMDAQSRAEFTTGRDMES